MVGVKNEHFVITFQKLQYLLNYSVYYACTMQNYRPLHAKPQIIATNEAIHHAALNYSLHTKLCARAHALHTNYVSHVLHRAVVINRKAEERISGCTSSIKLKIKTSSSKSRPRKVELTSVHK